MTHSHYQSVAYECFIKKKKKNLQPILFYFINFPSSAHELEILKEVQNPVTGNYRL